MKITAFKIGFLAVNALLIAVVVLCLVRVATDLDYEKALIPVVTYVLGALMGYYLPAHATKAYRNGRIKDIAAARQIDAQSAPDAQRSSVAAVQGIV